MPTTDYFAATKGLPLKTVPGRLTLTQVLGFFDALSGVRVTCSHTIRRWEDLNGWEPNSERTLRLRQLTDAIPGGADLTLPACQRLLRTWEKWTRQFSRDMPPDLSAVQSFLFEINRK
jgi:hypothetical protein